MNIKSIGNKIKGNPTMTEGTVYSILVICGISHFLNDMIQSIIPSIYPIIKDKSLDFVHGGFSLYYNQEIAGIGYMPLSQVQRQRNI